MFKNKKVFYYGLAVVVGVILIIFYISSKHQDVQSLDSISLDSYEITFWDADGEFVVPGSYYKTPIEIIVNTADPKVSRSCLEAKQNLGLIMKGIWTNQEFKRDVSRVLFTAPGYLRASLGSDVATSIKWSEMTPNSFWALLEKQQAYEDESGELNSRTWGSAFGGCK